MEKMQREEYSAIEKACRALPRPSRSYLEEDFVSNLMLTVLDYQLHNKIVTRAYEHYTRNHWDKVRTLEDLRRFFAQFGDDMLGNRAAAQSLWGYGYSKRMGQLRQLIDYFESIGVTEAASLRRWAQSSTFERDFSGKVRGLGFAVYKWLLIRVGVETVKPDVHIKRFLKGVAGRQFGDEEAVRVLEEVAGELGWKVYELDWAIWEYQRGEPGTR